jgi:hypothetical protein
VTVPAATEWNAVAFTKLTNVLGDGAGRRLMAEVLDDLGIDVLRSPDDLVAFADALRPRGGFAGALAGLLSLHAAMYGDTRPRPNE